MAFTMKEVGRSLSEEDIRTLEFKLSLLLPKDYKAFLLANNGGRPEPDAFPILNFENNPKDAIADFFGIDQELETDNIEWNYTVLKGRIPNHLLPIADTGSGDLICLSLSGIDKGKVYFWDHEGEHEPPTYDNVYLIADSFEEFLDSIHFWDPLEGIDVDSMIIEGDVKGDVLK